MKNNSGYIVLICAVLMLACSITATVPSQTPSTTATSEAILDVSTTSTPRLSIDSDSGYAVVIAQTALNLRDRPDPVIGKILTSMRSGSSIVVVDCVIVDGSFWVHGTYIDDSGKIWIGWANAYYIQGVCNAANKQKSE